MEIIKHSRRESPRISLILLDWGVRESFHLFDYLRAQTIDRDSFEVIMVEFYDYISEPLKRFEDMLDTWVLLQFPWECIYHKHLMYNTGILMAKGDIVMIGDSDAMVRENFLSSIVKCFDEDSHLVLHLDQFRNVRRDFYPFNYPSFEEVLGDGCINNVGGKTKGLLDLEDPMHARNYGACMCARRQDLISIGGADEDITYLGHVCGPYDLTFRLMNWGRRMVWHQEEFLYHTWHPGSDGKNNYCGPHDGRNMSTTAFQALVTGRVTPIKGNKAITLLQKGNESIDNESIWEAIIDPAYKRSFLFSNFMENCQTSTSQANIHPNLYCDYKGIEVYHIEDCYYACLDSTFQGNVLDQHLFEAKRVIKADSFVEIRRTIDEYIPISIDSIGKLNLIKLGELYAVVPQSLGQVNFHIPEERNNPAIFYTDNLQDAIKHARALAAVIRPTPGEAIWKFSLSLLRRIASKARRTLFGPRPRQGD